MKYRWQVDFIFVKEEYERGNILRLLDALGASDTILQRVGDKMYENRINAGFTYSNAIARHSVVVIGKVSRGAEFLNSFCHELRHLTDDIALACNVPLASEEAAYLTGDISLALSDIVCEFSCPHCKQ